MTWYDGGLTPPKPVEMGDEELNKGGGVLYIGTKGKLLHDTYGFNPRLLPKSLHESVGKPKETYARITTSHEMNWIDAIRGTQKTTSPFEYSAKLTEIMLLGVAALNAGKKIQYDGAEHEDHQRAGLGRAAEAQVPRRLGIVVARSKWAASTPPEAPFGLAAAAPGWDVAAAVARRSVNLSFEPRFSPGPLCITPARTRAGGLPDGVPAVCYGP